MSKKCNKCGNKLNKDGSCPVCKNIYRENKKNTADKKDNYLKKPLIIMGVSLALIIVITVALGLLVFNDVINIPFVNDIFVNTGMKEIVVTEEPSATGESTKPEAETEAPLTDLGDDYVPPSFDADEYFENNTTLYNDYSASSSPNVLTESEVYDDFIDRGFVDAPIETEYSINGEYYELYEISSYSSLRHPIYQTYFESSLGNLWMIYNVDGSVFAIPITYNYDEEADVPVIISETNTIISYDATTNKFYENIPDTADNKIITVERIDSEALELLTSREIDER